MIRVIIALMIAIGIVVVYLSIGYAVSIKSIPHFREVAERDYSSESYIRRSIRGQIIAMTLLWPVMLPSIVYIKEVDKAIDNHDPKLLQRKIEKLETELYGKRLS